MFAPTSSHSRYNVNILFVKFLTIQLKKIYRQKLIDIISHSIMKSNWQIGFSDCQKNRNCQGKDIPSPEGKVTQQIHLIKKSNEFGESDEECGRRTSILHYIGTYSCVEGKWRYRHWKSTNNSARIPHQSRFSVRRTFEKRIGAYKRTENSTASPRGKQYLKSNFTVYIL